MQFTAAAVVVLSHVKNIRHRVCGRARFIGRVSAFGERLKSWLVEASHARLDFLATIRILAEVHRKDIRENRLKRRCPEVTCGWCLR